MSKRPVVPHPTDPSLAIVELTKGYAAVISREDAAAVGKFNWYASEMTGGVYAVRGGIGGRMPLHRFIASRIGLFPTPEIDHVNGDRLDNRRSNLRAATHAQNMQNRKASTGMRGVSGGGKRGWRAYVIAFGKRHYFGTFTSSEAAAKAAAAGRVALHGDFARS